MRLALVSLLGDEARQMEVGWLDLEGDFLPGFPASAGVRRFACFRMQFSPARTPQAAIWLLRPFEQQYFVPLVEAVKQRRNLIRQNHAAE